MKKLSKSWYEKLAGEVTLKVGRRSWQVKQLSKSWQAKFGGDIGSRFPSRCFRQETRTSFSGSTHPKCGDGSPIPLGLPAPRPIRAVCAHVEERNAHTFSPSCYSPVFTILDFCTISLFFCLFHAYCMRVLGRVSLNKFQYRKSSC